MLLLFLLPLLPVPPPFPASAAAVEGEQQHPGSPCSSPPAALGDDTLPLSVLTSFPDFSLFTPSKSRQHSLGSMFSWGKGGDQMVTNERQISGTLSHNQDVSREACGHSDTFSHKALPRSLRCLWCLFPCAWISPSCHLPAWGRLPALCVLPMVVHFGLPWSECSPVSQNRRAEGKS